MLLDIIVIGGGAAGMVAAYAAASKGAEVLLLEKNEKLGKKIYITGKGRCNVTNACDFDELIRNTVRNPKFMYSAYKRFSNWDLYDLLESAGCSLKIERGNRVFPVSDHASDVTRALSSLMKDAGVSLRLDTEVMEVSALEDGSFRVKTRDRRYGCTEELCCRALIVATGGLSYPTTGSTGDGYRFAEELGIHVTGCIPSLVPLMLREQEETSELSGLSLKNVSLSLYMKSRLVHEEQGEMLFTHDGVSGPLVLTASSYLGEELLKSDGDCRLDGKLPEGFAESRNGERHLKETNEGRQLFEGADISIDLKPALSTEKLDARILRELEAAKNQHIKNILRTLLPSSLIMPVLKRSGIDGDTPANSITREQRRALCDVIKGLRYQVTGFGGFNQAVITKGGVDVKEIDPKTMGTKKLPGLYFAGEVLDTDCLTGGFNITAAAAIGHVAGTAAAEYVMNES